MTEAVAGPGQAADASDAVADSAEPGGPRHRHADGESGLRMQRVFTRDGVHPYDEVSWTRRDVVLTNWRDGSINFSQQGVEFPEFWSVNAVNIVTSKYFRGAIGSPQRESSLRQLLDRVVDTYSRVGLEHGYFATDADAEVFNHELKWLLVHQHFSFNSPVWFNVGTPAAQFVSACFILSVDDTMDSILNWYREEGLIFKGGSGAGVNLSRIRSSKELLSSGGTASGPVSFMRGADSSAGTIKSGGATRRAAKMVVLDVDHPDIGEFVETKAREEHKIRALRDAGFDMDLGGRDIVSAQYQNANNSVRVTDEFMRSVEEGKDFGLRARQDGEVLENVDARKLFRTMAQAAWECADPGIQYDDTINDWHTNPEAGRITASNPCSEYLSLDNSSCNLASLNLMKFRREDDTFDAEKFVKVVELVTTAMDISICFADFPTEAIGQTTRDYRQLGIGYCNLGALLMATGHAYDSEGGRALAGAITSLMTGTAYKRSAELAGVVGPYVGYAKNAAAHTRVMRKHAAANDAVRPVGADDARILRAAGESWQKCLDAGTNNGWRNAQGSVLAPTGCLVPETLVTTDRGLARLGELGDSDGDRWQDADFVVSTDEGPRDATKFFVNGEQPTRKVTTKAGYRVHGTPNHRVKVVDRNTGAWEWKCLAEIGPGDVIPLQLGTLVGEPHRVPLPTLDQAYYTGDRSIDVPDRVDADLAELVGYFMGDGSLHAKGLRLCVADTDLDVVERLRVLSKGLFNLEPVVTAKQGYHEVALQSVRLARWWEAAGFAKKHPGKGHVGKGWEPHVPAAILETNDREAYAAFVRGLFEADGAVSLGVPNVSSARRGFIADLQVLLLSLGYPTTIRVTDSGWGGKATMHQLRLRNIKYVSRYIDEIGFLSHRKATALAPKSSAQAGNRDDIFLSDDAWHELVPVGDELRGWVQQAIWRRRGVSRGLAARILERRWDERLAPALGFIYEEVESNGDGGLQPTYDLSVPSNVTYVAGGFVSHNTISFFLDSDTTGVEPDLALVKYKKLADGGSMQIVNRTVPLALRSLGYHEEQVEAIVDYVAETGTVVDAPGMRPEHYEVFDCAIGDRAISWMGHVRMLAAVQPFLSGSASKTINMPESATVADVEKAYFEGWRLGLKALAIYRDNCKVGQPLSDGKARKPAAEAAETAEAAEKAPVRKRLPKVRPSQTVSFAVGGAEGYMTASSYPDNGLGEVFLKMSKQGSTLAGVMDAFSIAISIALQYGVPLETYVSKFINMRFDPAGMTDDPDVRMAQSVVDYIFRRLALDYLPYETRAELGVFTAAERTAAANATTAGGPATAPHAAAGPPAEVARGQSGSTGTGGADDDDQTGQIDVEGLRSSAPIEPARSEPVDRSALTSTGSQTTQDAPLCLTCGVKMRPSGSCYVCESCGSTSGCS